MTTLLDAMKRAAAIECKAAGKRDGRHYRPGGVPSDLIGRPAASKVDARARLIGRLLRDHGDLSRADLIVKAKLTPTTINNALARCKEMGFCHYAGRALDVWRYGTKAAANGKALGN